MDNKLKLIKISAVGVMVVTTILLMAKVVRHLYLKNIYNKTIKNIIKRLEEAKTMIDEATMLIQHALNNEKK